MSCGAGIITELGCVPKVGDSFQVASFFQQHGLFLAQPPSATAIAPPPGFKVLDTTTMREYVAQHEALYSRVGPLESSASWTVSEIGDGNINYVYVVSGPLGGVVVKQGLPHIRVIGESWPLSQVPFSHLDINASRNDSCDFVFKIELNLVWIL